MKKALTRVAMLTLVAAFLVPSSALAQGVKRAAASTNTTAESTAETTNCDYTKPEKEDYKASFIALRKPGVVEKGELFETKVYIRNMGNTPWFSVASGCAGPHVSLGTDKDRDRSSQFYPGAIYENSGWDAPNRITMTSDRVDPGYLAEFVFTSRAPQEDGYFREVYTPVVEGLGWLDESLFTSDIRVGDGNIPLENKDLLQYIKVSANLSNYNLEGEKWINVDISEQKMRLHVGDYVVREFPVSTGKASTPTPVGTTHIFQKQEVRVGYSWPHYIMPKWMHFRAGGYGIHALPSLANDGGVFWTEALNHIGTRRSHGCIRLLPQDAAFAYDFAPIGTKIVVQY